MATVFARSLHKQKMSGQIFATEPSIESLSNVPCVPLTVGLKRSPFPHPSLLVPIDRLVFKAIKHHATMAIRVPNSALKNHAQRTQNSRAFWAASDRLSSNTKMRQYSCSVGSIGRAPLDPKQTKNSPRTMIISDTVVSHEACAGTTTHVCARSAA